MSAQMRLPPRLPALCAASCAISSGRDPSGEYISPGGLVTDGLALYDVMKGISCPTAG